jgi:ubiquitin carboxyl-terminal hydrolase 2/21|tara:strand:- start:3731 stop:4693 length:963 start_codon:yes stop_codon:yes gene_type:complete
MSFGLPNIGYTCYLNTSLQCLFNCVCFIEYIADLKSSDILHLNNLYDVFSNAQSTKKYKHDSYITFLKNIHKYIPSISINNENDIHEFIVLFIDIYFEHFKRVVKINKPVIKTSSAIIKYNSDALWYNQYSKICDITFSQQIIKTECKNCGFKLHNYETTSIISIDISDDSSDSSISTGVDKHFSTTNIEDYQCDKCKLRNNTQKTTYLARTPKLLMVCLKRFSFENDQVIKNNNEIKIERYLDLSQYLYFDESKKTTSNQYSLKSIALHHGNAYNGHYTSIVFDGDETKFIDDLNVIDVKNKEININSSAYLVIYESTK